MRLEARQIGFRYGHGFWLFRRAELTVRPGEIVGLFGPSGCGKTTLCRILAGYETPAEGEVTLDDHPLPRAGYHPVQMVFQHPEQSVNPRWRLGRTLAEGQTIGPELPARLGIDDDWLERRPNELSGGELQRICIARALGHGTRFLIADEMTAMLDAVSQAQIWRAVLDEAGSRNLGVLVISHDRHLLRRICGRIVDWEEIAASRRANA